MTVAKSCCCVLREGHMHTASNSWGTLGWGKTWTTRPQQLGTGGCALPIRGFPGGAVIKNLPDNAGDAGDIPAFDPWVGMIL